MKAVMLKGFGGVENLVKTDLPVPEISDNEVLVKIKAISVNPIDIKTRKGAGLAGILKEADPIILGWDISGIITARGDNVVAFREGDEVFGMINFPGHGKAYAEYVAAPETHLALKPATISHEEAAGASLAALTAWQVLTEKAGIRKGDNILIHAAAGGVGHFAVQMARHLGALVACTSSARNKDFVLNLGAGQHIDYEKEKFENVLHDLDFVLDTIGNEYTDRSFDILKPGGTIICIPSGTSGDIEERAGAKGLHGSHFRVRSDGKGMREIADLLEKGIVKSFISGQYTLDGIREAHLHIETGKTRGKIVVTP